MILKMLQILSHEPMSSVRFGMRRCTKTDGHLKLWSRWGGGLDHNLTVKSLGFSLRRRERKLEFVCTLRRDFDRFHLKRVRLVHDLLNFKIDCF